MSVERKNKTEDENMSKKIMVVDDYPDTGELMQMILTTHGFDPITFTDPTKALDALRTGQMPDLLILDMRMPDMSGIDFCNELRKDSRFDHLRIAFFTASNELDAKLLDEHVVLGYISKPFHIKGLIEDINKYLTKQVPLIARHA